VILPDEDLLVQLLKKRHNAALMALQASYREFLVGRGTVEFVYDAARNLLTARLELCTAPTDQLALRRDYLNWTQRMESIQKSRMQQGRAAAKAYHEATSQRLQAELELRRAEAGLDRR
jgi:hypothetical protein